MIHYIFNRVQNLAKIFKVYLCDIRWNMSFLLFSFTFRYYTLFVMLRVHATLGGYIGLTSCQINVYLPSGTEKVEKSDSGCT